MVGAARRKCTPSNDALPAPADGALQPLSPPPVPALPQPARIARVPVNPKFSLALDAETSPTSTFYIDLERDGAVVPIGSALRPISYGMFPEDVIDPDQPVTRSVRSQWVRADSDTSSTR